MFTPQKKNTGCKISHAEQSSWKAAAIFCTPKGRCGSGCGTPEQPIVTATRPRHPSESRDPSSPIRKGSSELVLTLGGLPGSARPIHAGYVQTPLCLKQTAATACSLHAMGGLNAAIEKFQQRGAFGKMGLTRTKMMGGGQNARSCREMHNLAIVSCRQDKGQPAVMGLVGGVGVEAYFALSDSGPGHLPRKETPKIATCKERSRSGYYTLESISSFAS